MVMKDAELGFEIHSESRINKTDLLMYQLIRDRVYERKSQE